MKIGRDKLRKILLEEACGCMASEPSLEYFEDEMDHEFHGENIVPQSGVDKDSVLNCVAVLAISVNCPVTREALLSTVYDLMS